MNGGDQQDEPSRELEETSDADPDETAEEEEQGDEATGAGDLGGNSGSVLPIHAVSNLDSLYGLREIGKEALCWQLSSAKPGNGVEQIRDQSTDTYWQSDGVSQPHLIQVHFARRVAISHICLYLDYNLDESYTPKNISVQVGMTTQDLVPAIHAATLVELNEPVGWCIIPLTSPPDPLDDMIADVAESSAQRTRRIVRTHLVQIEICSMHQNGRDTHVRQVQLYGPRTTTGRLQTEPLADAITNAAEIKQRSRDDEFSTISMSQFSLLRACHGLTKRSVPSHPEDHCRTKSAFLGEKGQKLGTLFAWILTKNQKNVEMISIVTYEECCSSDQPTLDLTSLIRLSMRTFEQKNNYDE